MTGTATVITILIRVSHLQTIANRFTACSIAAVALAFITICLLLLFPGWQTDDDDDGSEREVKLFPPRPLTQIALTASTLGAMFALVSMVWQHTASVATATTAQTLGYGTVKSTVGATVLALGWVGFAVLVLAALGLLIMILSIRILAELTDD